MNYLRECVGQVIQTDGTSLTDCKYYYERTPIGIYLRTKSKVSFLLGALHADTAVADTLFLIQMTMGSREIAPLPAGAEVGGLANYYLGSITAEAVKARDRVVYPETFDSTDVHFYYGPTGPRMAIVMRPGADPSEVKFTFAGQDSINVDWQGALRLYSGERYISLHEAFAYQIDDNGGIVPVGWLPDYVVEPGNVNVGFDYETYNPDWPLILLTGYAMPPQGGGGSLGNLGWCTHTGSTFANEMTSIEVDAEGDPYACGYFSHFFYPLQFGSTSLPPNENELAESRCGAILKFDKESKQILWGTYVGGVVEGETRAHKLALYTGSNTSLKYAFVTGSTNSNDFESRANSLSPFAAAHLEDHVGGDSRMWVGACKMSNGILDWSTTYGQPAPDRTWSTHGLAVAIGRDGRLAVAGMVEKGFNSDVPEFPLVTPTGAFSRALGDGFLVSFKSDFSVDWSTALLEYSGNSRLGRINDMRYTATDADHPGVWLVGASLYGTSEPLDLVPPPSGGYYQSVAGELSAVIMQVDLSDHQIAYCTRWGSPGTAASSSALAIHETNDYMYVGGFTQAFDLTSTECPSPGQGTQVFYTTTNATSGDQASDGFLLRFNRFSGYQLGYGTLLGGDRDDIVLDVNSNGAGHVYLTGESRSSYGLTIAIPTDHYTQPHLTEFNRRDAFIHGIHDDAWPGVFWATAFGGTKSDRGWGIAASSDELYLCGTTGSSYFDDFPFLEWNTDSNDPNSELDWYMESSPAAIAYELVPWMTFFQAMDYDVFGIDVFIEGLNSFHDGFIASFNMNEAVHVAEAAPNTSAGGMTALPLSEGEGYLITLPFSAPWHFELYDSRGRQISSASAAGMAYELRTDELADGVYVIKARTGSATYSAKLIAQ